MLLPVDGPLSPEPERERFSWSELLDFMLKGLEIGPYAPPGGVPRTRKGLRRRNA